MDAFQDVASQQQLIVQCPSPKLTEGALAAASANKKQPNAEYLAAKRRSVFSRPYERSVQEIVELFTPPVYEKTQAQIDRIASVLTGSFLTKHLSK